LNASDRFSGFVWSTGDTTQTIYVHAEGYYSVTATDIFGFTSTDEIFVDYLGNFFTNQTNTNLCEGEVYTFDLGLDTSFYSILWSDNSNGTSITVSVPGPVFVQVTDSNN